MRRITNQEAAKSLGTDVESLKKQLQGKKKRNEASVKALPEINNDEVIKRRIRDLTTPNGTGYLHRDRSDGCEPYYCVP